MPGSMERSWIGPPWREPPITRNNCGVPARTCTSQFEDATSQRLGVADGKAPITRREAASFLWSSLTDNKSQSGVVAWASSLPPRLARASGPAHSSTLCLDQLQLVA